MKWAYGLNGSVSSPAQKGVGKRKREKRKERKVISRYIRSGLKRVMVAPSPSLGSSVLFRFSFFKLFFF